MGLQQSKTKNEDLKEQPVIQKKDLKNFTVQNLIHNQQTCLSYQLFTFQQQYFIKFITLIKSRQKLKHKNFITVKKYWRKKSMNHHKIACNSIERKVELYVEYQYKKMNMSIKLDNLEMNKKYMPEIQIKKIFLQLLSCLIYLKANNTCHGDIKPENIIFDQLGNVKLIDSLFINGGKTSYQIVLQNPSSMSFLSPQQLQKLRFKQFDSTNNIYSNQAFSLGLTMYQCMSLKRGMQCYDLDTLKINKSYFDDKFQLLMKIGYTKKLVDLVLGLILNESDKRLCFQEIFDILAQY